MNLTERSEIHARSARIVRLRESPPWTFTYLGYGVGAFPAGNADYNLFLVAAHTVNLAWPGIARDQGGRRLDPSAK